MMIYFCTKFVTKYITKNKYNIMKKTVLMSVMFLLTLLFSCTSQTYVEPKTLEGLITLISLPLWRNVLILLILM